MTYPIISAAEALDLVNGSPILAEKFLTTIGIQIRGKAEDGERFLKVYFPIDVVPHCESAELKGARFVDNVVRALRDFGYRVNLTHDTYERRGDDVTVIRPYIEVFW